MIRLIWIFLPILLFSATIKVDILNKNNYYAQKAVVCHKKLYIYDKPSENSNKILFNNAGGVKLDIYSCNRYGWCKLYNNKYVKLYKLRDSCDCIPSIELQKKVDEAIYGKLEIKKPTKPKPPQKIKKDKVIKKDKIVAINEDNNISNSFVKEPIIKDSNETIVSIDNDSDEFKQDFLIEDNNESNITNIQIKPKDKFMIYYLGKSYTNSSVSDYSYLIEYGFFIQKSKIFTTFALGNSVFDNFHIINFLTSLGYQFQTDYKPYISFIMGISSLEWDNTPNSNLKALSGSSTSALYGLGGGCSYSIAKDIDIVGDIKYLKANFTTKIQETKTYFIREKYIRSILIGIKYKF
jgi:hypothetical protein